MMELTLSNVGKRFGRKVLFEGISGTYTSARLAIAGPNGSGKSTLMKTLVGLLKPSSGTVSWSKNGDNLPKEAWIKHIGYAAPYLNLYDELTVWENLVFIVQSRGNLVHTDVLEQLVQDIGLWHRKDLAAKRLSSGQVQRLRIAAALAPQPEVLMLDEPGTNLDETGKETLFKMLDTHPYRPQMLILASNESNELHFCTEQITLTPTDL